MKIVKQQRAFTLVELLAAMAFMAIVIPVTMQALTIANRAGVVAQRKAVAARVLERALNEYVASSANNNVSKQKGVALENEIEFAWNIRQETWKEDRMRLVTCEVTYPAQGQEYSIQASTLIGLTTQ